MRAELKKAIILFGLLLAIVPILCMASCTKDNDDVDWSEEKVIEVSPEIVPVYIFGDPNKVDGMLVKIDGENNTYPIRFIDGFEFETGYAYILKVRITHLANPPQDGYNVRLELVSLISKTKV